MDAATDHTERLAARIRELETICTDVLVAGVDLGLPQHLLNRLWGAVGHGDMPHAFIVDLPAAIAGASPAAPRPQPVAPIATALEPAPATPETPGSVPPFPAPAANGSTAHVQPATPMPIPDIPLSTNPLVTGAVPTGRSLAVAELKPLKERKTVLVVDDDPMMLEVLSRVLQRENFDLIVAGGGPEALDKLQRHGGHLDLLITDFLMPGMHGRDLAERVRVRFPEVRVLYQTGFSDMLFENLVELEEGAAFLEKPFTARGLREAARLVLFGTLNP
jgi:CheY-like chemotaxis protein